MPLQYTDLIVDHDEIAAGCAKLVVVAEDGTLSAASIAEELHNLALIVRDHIAVEAPLIDLLDNAALSGPWLESWLRGRPAYIELKQDWQDFLSEWDGEAIEADRVTFLSQVRAIAARLDERVTLESRIFYALALQKGGVQFYIR